MRIRAALVILLAGLPTLAACGGGGGGKAPPFEEWARKFVEDPDSSVLLPDPARWFKAHFPADLASSLASDYETEAEKSGGKGGGISGVVAKAREKGQTEVKVASFTAAVDMAANGLQNAALQRMTSPATLHTIRMTKPGEASGTTIWSFAEVDGTYRFVGKMRRLNPTRGDLVADVLCSLPLSAAEAQLRENGLLTSSAVDYLKRIKVLQ